jgi:hypothetical protein
LIHGEEISVDAGIADESHILVYAAAMNAVLTATPQAPDADLMPQGDTIVRQFMDLSKVPHSTLA